MTVTPPVRAELEQAGELVQAGLRRRVRPSLRSTPSTRRSSVSPLSALARISAKLSASSGGGSAALYGSGLRLDRDHRHVVRDHVVQFPGDALALLQQRPLAFVPPLLHFELHLELLTVRPP